MIWPGHHLGLQHPEECGDGQWPKPLALTTPEPKAPAPVGLPPPWVHSAEGGNHLSGQVSTATVPAAREQTRELSERSLCPNHGPTPAISPLQPMCGWPPPRPGPHLLSRGEVLMAQRTPVCQLLWFGSCNGVKETGFSSSRESRASSRRHLTRHPIPAGPLGRAPRRRRAPRTPRAPRTQGTARACTHGYTPSFLCVWAALPSARPRCSGNTFQTRLSCRTPSASAPSGWRSPPPASRNAEGSTCLGTRERGCPRRPVPPSSHTPPHPPARLPPSFTVPRSTPASPRQVPALAREAAAQGGLEERQLAPEGTGGKRRTA